MRNPCVAHRGWSSLAPENTLAALKLAAEAADVGWAEVDVQLSADHVPVLVHDRKLRRTANGGGAEPGQLTAAQMGKLDAGGWFSAKYRGEKLPTLEEALRETGDRLRFNIELKHHGTTRPLEEKVIETIHRAGMADRCVLTSFSRSSLRRVKELDERLQTGLITDSWSGKLPAELLELGCSLLSIDYRSLNRERLKQLRAHGLRTMAWTLNEFRLIRRYALMDAELMICTDDPSHWRAALRSLPERDDLSG
ncbi:glycerophosphodiester phosphodiesterase [Paenibacillus pasadenensis]|uniref:glycerophosphodiester phosphodiesterase n=1 Tax=Paenibacillus pasadenensis TaxID=217090 RepID=UPI00203AEB44|nr:glycerophosphodiester phosphodiesterase family protein [Paenibacillus pasadenensis]MCM3747125.1 glycerophosphodiester phosphodiesterase [Paenibacillus pasadenensis]